MFKVWCEWDMGQDWENTVFTTREKAQASIDQADWSSLVGMTQQEVEEDGLVGVDKLEVD